MEDSITTQSVQTIDAADVPKSLQLCSAKGRVGRAVDLDDQNTYGLFNLGQAYYASGNKNEAKEINDRLRKINPTLAANLDNIFSGKAVLDNATRKVEQKYTEGKSTADTVLTYP